MRRLRPLTGDHRERDDPGCEPCHRDGSKATRIRVRVSIDEFGAGYSSLSYLHQFPFDTLKIDRSFVNALQRQSEGHRIVQTILDLTKNLRMDVVAEGAETAYHAD